METSVESKAKTESVTSNQPSYESLHNVALAALWTFHRRLGRSEKYIKHALSGFDSPQPSRFPPDIPFPLENLSNHLLTFLIGHSSQKAPFYPVLKREIVRRSSENPAFVQAPIESLMPPPDLFEQIAYNGRSK